MKSELRGAQVEFGQGHSLCHPAPTPQTPRPLQTTFPRIPNSTSLKAFGYKCILGACAKNPRRASVLVQMVWHQLWPCPAHALRTGVPQIPTSHDLLWQRFSSIYPLGHLRVRLPGTHCTETARMENTGPSVGSTNPDLLQSLEFSQKPGLKCWHHLIISGATFSYTLRA